MATNLTKRWQLGRDVGSMTLIPLGLDTDGVTFVPATSVSLVGILEEFQYGVEGQNEEIGPMDTRALNEQIVTQGVSMTLRENVQRGVQPKLEALMYTHDYAKVTWLSGGKLFTFIGVIRPGAGVTYVRGKQVYQLSLGPVAVSGDQTVNLTITTPP